MAGIQHRAEYMYKPCTGAIRLLVRLCGEDSKSNGGRGTPPTPKNSEEHTGKDRKNKIVLSILQLQDIGLGTLAH